MERASNGLVTRNQFRLKEQETKRWLSLFNSKMESLITKSGILFLVVGFLLGRALILSQLAPFSIPFFAAVYMIKRDRAPHVLLGLIAGAATIEILNVLNVFISAIFFLILYKAREPSPLKQVKVTTIYVLISFGLTNFLLHYLKEGQLLLYDGVMLGVETILAGVLTLIFFQCIPLISLKKRTIPLRTEEIVSVIILMASIMTGTIGWTIYELSFEHLFSRYLVLIFSLAAGAAIGSTVGVVTGLVFSLANIGTLYQMSLLAFSGLLGGLLKEGKKIGASIGLLIATCLIGLYGEGGTPLLISLYESLGAILLFLLTPSSLIEKVAKYIPGTLEHSNEQQKYMRKMRDVTAHKVAQFSNVFGALSDSFSQVEDWNKEEHESRELDFFLSNVTEKTCQTCPKKEACWSRNFHTTYEGMKTIMEDLQLNNQQISLKTEREWSRHCTRPKQVVSAISQELSFYQANQKLKKQVKDSRRLVADQLRGVSDVMEDFAKEIQRERKNHEIQEEQIFEAVSDFGIQLSSIEIFSLEQGNIDIDMMLPSSLNRGETEKLIAPILSDLLGETIIVALENQDGEQNSNCVNFRSAQRFAVTTGVAHTAKGGGLISGDSYTMVEIGAGKYAMAISDGMGNGERAKMESAETLQLLKKILLSGIEERIAIKSVNSILSLRTTDEIFSTLDLVMIDLQDAKANFLKICSTPSFIKRGDRVFKIESSNLPIGFMEEEMEVDVVTEQLKAEDLLIMMSDGILEGGPRSSENEEYWIKRKIKELKTDHPQEIADVLLEDVIRSRGDVISDDMTVVVAKIKHNTPKWSTIPVSSFRKRVQ